MPASAIAAGAADVVIPLADLGHLVGELVGELVARRPRQHMRSEVEAIRRVFGDRGEMPARAREVDWSQAPLGPAAGWPEALRMSARTIMDSPNPQALGGRARDTWPEIWDTSGRWSRG